MAQIPLQEKIAELERRIVALEARQVPTRASIETFIVKSEDRFWATVERLFDKVRVAGKR